MKRLFLVFIIFSVFVGVLAVNSSVRAQEEGRSQIAYVDMEALFINHPDKSSAEEQLNAEAQWLQSQLEEKAVDMTKEERQVLLQSYQEKLNRIEQELVSEVMENINGLIREVAQERGISVVVDKATVIYGGVDLTDEVLSVVNEEIDGLE
ncbi:OmpH family outer membrane protein [Halonatronum saccharophilum]|uniref:OmpH family outer membrane protein n=1 Tax=Halonatronum saccharophilum TaxID=150060 RepID=UPI0004837D2E|nr:OmpH family outer membrane protein [Halonatronum saccharophilum]